MPDLASNSAFGTSTSIDAVTWTGRAVASGGSAVWRFGAICGAFSGFHAAGVPLEPPDDKHTSVIV